ncbi:hypothetical protein GCM10025857_32650 [Alicyclobacillus contaminans]|nr:hypothetical protein GCM10025857_32650 [Alicyclobacillus contaminans]
MVTLDGETRKLDEDTLVISDAERAIGIAGVMGGQNSEITAGTKSVVLESAAFDAVSVRRTGQRLGLKSEAQQRFEKGIDPNAITGALVRATELFAELTGATPVGAPVCVDGPGTKLSMAARAVPFQPARCNMLLGTDHGPELMRDVFRRLGFAVETETDDQWRVLVPPRRPDVVLEADLVEEVGRIAGYAAIPSTLPATSTTVGYRPPLQVLSRRTRNVLMAVGMNEVVTYTLTHPREVDALRVPADSPYRSMIPLLHPMSEERTALRTHMLPSLAEVARYNLAHGVSGGAIFEVGRVYWPTELPLRQQPCEHLQWAGLWFGELEPAVGERARPYDFYDAKGAIETWLEALGWLDDARFVPVRMHWLHPGRSAEVQILGQRVGTFGEVHPETAAALDIRRAVYAEFDLERLQALTKAEWKVQRLPKYPASRRDLAVLVDVGVPVQALLDAARDAAAEASILENCALFDIYQGKGVAEGQKSVAVAFRYRADDRTLTDDEIVQVEQRIVRAWADQFGATLRTV